MKDRKLESLSIFFPCYNDEKTIGNLVEQAFVIGSKVSHDLEVIVVDDGSSDGSTEVLQKLKRKHRNFRPIFHKSNKGYGGALQSGFQASKKEFIFYTDGDSQYTLEDLPVLVSLMTPEVDFVNGIKTQRQDPTYRIIVGNLYALIVRWLFWLPVYDVDCDFRLIRRTIISRVRLNSRSGAICVELVKKCQLVGAEFRQVSVLHKRRMHGSSQFFKPKRIASTFIELINLWFKLYGKSRVSETV